MYKAELDQRTAEQLQEFDKYAYEMQKERLLARQKERNLQERLQTEREKWGQLANAMELKKLADQATLERHAQELQQAREEAEKEKARQVQLGKQSVAQALISQHEQEQDASHKEMLRLKVDIEAREKEMAELKAKLKTENERNAKELASQRCEHTNATPTPTPSPPPPPPPSPEAATCATADWQLPCVPSQGGRRTGRGGSGRRQRQGDAGHQEAGHGAHGR